MSDPFSPLNIGPAALRNRFIRSGANEMMTKDDVPTKSLQEFHRRLAAGGGAAISAAKAPSGARAQNPANAAAIVVRSMKPSQACGGFLAHRRRKAMGVLQVRQTGLRRRIELQLMS